MDAALKIGSLQPGHASFRARIITGHLFGGRFSWSRTSDNLNHKSSAVAFVPTAINGLHEPSIDHDDDVVIVSALRTPICKSTRGGFKVR